MLFGDGAGALVVSNEASGLALRIDDVWLATDGNFAEDLCVRGLVAGQATLPVMNGRTVILHAVRKLTEATQTLLARNDLTLDQIDWIVPHQANLNLLRALGKKLEVNDDRIIVNLDRYGNTSNASAFLALHDAQALLQPGARVLVLAFGAGFTWGAALLTAAS
jgi:3-oxoacyl-[acyl-carrier-protein] synthase-3